MAAQWHGSLRVEGQAPALLLPGRNQENIVSVAALMLWTHPITASVTPFASLGE